MGCKCHGFTLAFTSASKVLLVALWQSLLLAKWKVDLHLEQSTGVQTTFLLKIACFFKRQKHRHVMLTSRYICVTRFELAERVPLSSLRFPVFTLTFYSSHIFSLLSYCPIFPCTTIELLHCIAEKPKIKVVHVPGMWCYGIMAWKDPRWHYWIKHLTWFKLLACSWIILKIAHPWSVCNK